MKNRLLISRRACFNPFLSNSVKSFAAAVTRFHHQRALQNSIRDVNCIFFFFFFSATKTKHYKHFLCVLVRAESKCFISVFIKQYD